MDGGAWWATVHGVKKSQTQLSDFSLTSVEVVFPFLPRPKLCLTKETLCKHPISLISVLGEACLLLSPPNMD